MGTTVRARPPRTRRALVTGYVALTKPRIIELLLVTTVPTMLLAEGGIPPWRLVAATLVGGALAAGSANTLNCYLDRDIDQVMHRTERRPLATGLVSPREALVFGVALGVVSVAWLAVTTGCCRPRWRWRPSRSTSGSTRWPSSAARRRTSCGAARRAACPC